MPLTSNGYRRRVVLTGSALALFGTGLLLALLLSLLWMESYDAEQDRAGSLAKTLGERTEAILVDTRDLLIQLDQLDVTACSTAHLQAMQEAAATRPHLRAIGHWRATERLCGVGFVASDGLRPPKADRIYESGVIAWWPSADTEVGGVPLFLMRYGEHDVAIDPRLLIDARALQDRKAGLWVEGLPMITAPSGAVVPDPSSLQQGLMVDTESGQLLSHFSHNVVFPIDIVAIEPLSQLWPRQRTMLLAGSAFALILLIGWLVLLLRVFRWRLSPENALRRGLRRGHIKAFYQPVIEFSSGRCVGAEALARWQREDGQLIGPNEFLPLAEQCGLTVDVTRAMLRSVLDDLPDLVACSPDVAINLNLSAADLENEAFGQALADGLKRTGLPAAAIKLEITERSLINSDLSRSLIRRFRSNGHKVAVDDFGTGYSSLSYLQTFELDILKIDKAFVDAIGTEAATSQVISHVIDMARALGLDVIAEGVESIEQANWLAEHKVQLAQGYLYSPALPAEEFRAYLRAHAGRASR